MRLFLDELIAYGGYGRVYRAHTTDSHQPRRVFAVKKLHTTRRVKAPMLRHEACAMISLRGHASFPEVYAWGRTQYYEYLALEELGSDIYEPSKSASGLTMRNLIALTCQMIDALEYVHSRHLVHCDVKPGNFLFERNPTGRIKLVDWGTAKIYRDPATRVHRPEDSIPTLIGTRAFTSINVHYHIRPTRRDDMESLAYTILSLLYDSLPWFTCKRNNEAYLRKKLKWSGAAIGNGYPAVFGAFLDHARALSFDGEPDYATWRDLFVAVAPGLPEPPLFSLSDASTRVGQHFWPSDVQPVPVRTPPRSYAQGIYGDDDNWVPTSTWSNPVNVSDDDLLGDEQETVARCLERIDETPGMDEPWLHEAIGYPPETIIPY
ncbi:kinase-like domain-containing protein [Schizophyllum commune]